MRPDMLIALLILEYPVHDHEGPLTLCALDTVDRCKPDAVLAIVTSVCPRNWSSHFRNSAGSARYVTPRLDSFMLPVCSSQPSANARTQSVSSTRF